MKESYWGYWLIVLGVFVILVMLLVQNVTATNTQDYYLAKEITEASMVDAVDYGYYRQYGEVRIIKEKFVESFVRRFAESASTSSTYKIEFFEIYEVPPKVSVKISTNSSSFNIAGDTTTFKIANKVDMIMETDPTYKYPEHIDDMKNIKDDPTITSAIESKPGTGSYVVKTGGKTFTIVDNTGQVFDENCQTYTVTFDKGKADKIGYDTFKCQVKDGVCNIYLPSIYKGNGNVYGWSTNPNASTSDGALLKPGSMVTVNGDKTFYAVADESTTTYEFNFVMTVEGLKNVSSSKEVCSINPKTAYCTITMPTATVESGYTFKGWSKSPNGSSGIIAAGSVLTVSRSMDSTNTYYPVIEKAFVPDTVPTPTIVPDTVVDDKTNSKTDDKNHASDEKCLEDDIYVSNLKDGDVKNATAWPQYSKVTVYEKSSLKGASKTIKAGTQMRIISCDNGAGNCKVWINGDSCSKYYYISQDNMLINLPDYIPSIVYNVKYGNGNDKKRGAYRNGPQENKKLGRKEYVVPARFELAKKILKAQNSLRTKKLGLKIYDAYRPVSGQTDPWGTKESKLNNVGCKYYACGASVHAFAGAIDVTLVDNKGNELSMVTKVYEYNSPSVKNASNDSKTKDNYKKLSDALTKVGLKKYSNEWWHFELNNIRSENKMSVAATTKKACESHDYAQWRKAYWKGTKDSYERCFFDANRISSSKNYSHLNFSPYLWYESGGN